MKPKIYCYRCGIQVHRKKTCPKCGSDEIGPEKIEWLSESTIEAYRTKRELDITVIRDLKTVTTIAKAFCEISDNEQLQLGEIVYLVKEDRWCDTERRLPISDYCILQICASNLDQFIAQETRRITRDNADFLEMHYALRDTIGKISRII